MLSIAELVSFDDDLHDDPCSDMQHIATDDVSGDSLNSTMVIAARKEELDCFESMHVYDCAPLTKCIARINKLPIGTRWIDTSKGNVEAPTCRSRLVAKEYKVDARPDWFAATPPVECMRLLISKAAESKSNKVLCVDRHIASLILCQVHPTDVHQASERRSMGWRRRRLRKVAHAHVRHSRRRPELE